MNSVGLLQKFIKDEVPSNSGLEEIYSCIVSNSTFDKLITCLKNTLDKSYDFAFLSQEAQILQSNRRDVRQLLELFAEMLGNKIDDSCDELVFTKPSRFEDYCPFPREDIVLYTNRPVDTRFVIYDGNKYEILDKKREETPYYRTWCYSVERC